MIDSKELVSSVRVHLGEIAPEKIQDSSIYAFATRVQDDIFARVRPETTYSIALTSSREVYPLPTDQIRISGYILSWPGDLTMVPMAEWNTVRTQNSGCLGPPTQATIIANQLFIAPYILSGSVADSGSISFFGHRIQSTYPISQFTGSTLPNYLDRALIYGTCANFGIDPQWDEKYERELENKSMIPFMKSGLTITRCNW